MCFCLGDDPPPAPAPAPQLLRQNMSRAQVRKGYIFSFVEIFMIVFAIGTSRRSPEPLEKFCCYFRGNGFACDWEKNPAQRTSRRFGRGQVIFLLSFLGIYHCTTMNWERYKLNNFFGD